LVSYVFTGDKIVQERGAGNNKIYGMVRRVGNPLAAAP
jgi:hypothetical protein